MRFLSPHPCLGTLFFLGFFSSSMIPSFRFRFLMIWTSPSCWFNGKEAKLWVFLLINAAIMRRFPHSHQRPKNMEIFVYMCVHVHVERKKAHFQNQKFKKRTEKKICVQSNLRLHRPADPPLRQHWGCADGYESGAAPLSTHPWCANFSFLLTLGARGCAKLQCASVDVEASKLGG